MVPPIKQPQPILPFDDLGLVSSDDSRLASQISLSLGNGKKKYHQVKHAEKTYDLGPGGWLLASDPCLFFQPSVPCHHSKPEEKDKQNCSYRHSLVITGNGIIHSINGAFLGLITGISGLKCTTYEILIAKPQ